MKCKKCPICGAENSIQMRICTSCGYSLLSVKVTNSQPAAVEKEQDQTKESSAESIAESLSADVETPSSNSTPHGFMRQCPVCGKILPYSTQICCGQSLAGVPPYTPSECDNLEAKEKPVLFMLRSEDGKSEIELSDGDDIIIGREATCADYLQPKCFVGRKQARIMVNDGCLMIEHVGTTNPTLVNQEPLILNKPRRINQHDLIILGAYPNQSPQRDAAYYRVICCE